VSCGPLIVRRSARMESCTLRLFKQEILGDVGSGAEVRTALDRGLAKCGAHLKCGPGSNAPPGSLGSPGNPRQSTAFDGKSR
jgi:hypothetical protein